MTITQTSSHHKLMVAFARLDLERYCRANPTREQATLFLSLWCGYDGMTEDEIAEVLAAYPVGDPEPVPGRDFLAEADADAAVIVAETLAGGGWEPTVPLSAEALAAAGGVAQYRDAEGDMWIAYADGTMTAGPVSPGVTRRPRAVVESAWGPLSEVTAQPTGEQVQP